MGSLVGDRIRCTWQRPSGAREPAAGGKPNLRTANIADDESGTAVPADAA